ncbi:Protein CBG18320 [Caenorhabditis briggsae]|uniref:Protein CBG18320 n=1 Tax=Caenorhabditis briggsae TaxID=6238 RepID=A8XSF2_CAEBR|nr:Protein CBG18320 [Caenorhabditis briggsae]CAP35794.2 Protein CBG18320 [Caenorhabditis briggsae]
MKDTVVKGSLKLKKVSSDAPKKAKKSKNASGSGPHKTEAELRFEARRQANMAERMLKRAAVSHREKVEKFNKQMEEMTEFNDIPKVSWTK